MMILELKLGAEFLGFSCAGILRLAKTCAKIENIQKEALNLIFTWVAERIGTMNENGQAAHLIHKRLVATTHPRCDVVRQECGYKAIIVVDHTYRSYTHLHIQLL